jgi:hypothetical protein
MARHLLLSPSSPTKTFVLEVHTDEPEEYLRDIGGSLSVEPTDDAYLFRVHRPEGTLWVDQLDERFWAVHTDMPVRPAFTFFREQVEARRDLDWIWLPSMHLRQVWPGAKSRRVRTDFHGYGFIASSAAAQDLKVQLSGRDAEALLDYISQNERYRSAVSFDGVQALLEDASLGWVKEGLNRMGRFAVSGDSLEFHLQFVRTVVRRYRRLVNLCEQKAISWQRLDEHGNGNGATVSGGPIVIQFSRPIDDLPLFLEQLFAARRPFRLWGIPEIVDGVAEIEAVDLHVGQRLRMDIGDRWMRVYLESGCCGNTVARLISNLQHRFDGALSLLDSELQAAMDARGPASVA